MNEVPSADSCADARPPTRDLCVPDCQVPAGGKSSQSYIALISMAILSSAEKRLVLGDIYKILAYWLPDRYNTRTTAWRNSIRHNLSLNECFVKAGRAANGKGNEFYNTVFDMENGDVETKVGLLWGSRKTL